MSDYRKMAGLLLRRLLVVVMLYQLCRILFMAFNSADMEMSTGAWVGGWIFDLSAIAYTNLVFVLLHLLPGRFKYARGYQKILRIAFFAVNLLFIGTNFVDFQYYKFTGRRSTFGMLTASGMENEIGGLLLSFAVEFWYLPVLFAAVALAFWKSLGQIHLADKPQNLTRNLIFKQSGVLVFALCLGLLFGRGTAKKPLRMVDAAGFGQGNAAFVLNTPFCVLKTIGKKETLAIPNWYSVADCSRIFDPEYRTKSSGTPSGKNAVLIILESFGREHTDRGYTPFLDSLATESRYYENGFANGKLSIDAVPSTLTSIPSLMSTSLITSGYALNKTHGMPRIASDNGYHTAFFHGAFNGSQNFDKYCRGAGFNAYYGMDEYRGPEAFDGKWGIFDEEFLQFSAREMNTFAQPFFSTVFTISSHNPYTIPKKYKGKFPKGDTKIAESIAYSDFALRRFFETAQKMPWYKNTVFVITADHTSSEPTEPQYRTAVGKFRIPILFFDPSAPQLKGIESRNFQQVDIMPALVDYLKLDARMVTFGQPSTIEKDFVVYFLDNIYHCIIGDYYLSFDGQKSIGLYKFKTDPLLATNLLLSEPKRVLEMEAFLKAYIQTFNTRLVQNKMLPV